MKRLLIVAIICLSAGHVLGMAQRPFDEPVQVEFRVDNPRSLHACAGVRALDQIARATHVLLGFENLQTCGPGPRSLFVGPDNENLTGMSARLAFNRFIEAMPSYSWKPVNGVAVIRPTEAWDDGDGLLNQTVQPFEARDQNVNAVLHAALEATAPSLFLPHTHVPRRGVLSSQLITVTFPGGTLLDAFNAMVTAHGSAEWEVGYVGGHAMIVLTTTAFSADAVMCPVALPQRHR
jgi:hypothetical protein